jgi:hypothetical protein
MAECYARMMHAGVEGEAALDVPLTGYTARLNSDREQAAWVLDILEANRRLAQEAG